MSKLATLSAAVVLAVSAAISLHAQTGPPSTDIYLAPIRIAGSKITVGTTGQRHQSSRLR